MPLSLLKKIGLKFASNYKLIFYHLLLPLNDNVNFISFSRHSEKEVIADREDLNDVSFQ